MQDGSNASDAACASQAPSFTPDFQAEDVEAPTDVFTSQLPSVSQSISSSVEAQQGLNSSKGVGLVLEAFSGSSRLTKACLHLGPRGVAVDKDRIRVLKALQFWNLI